MVTSLFDKNWHIVLGLLDCVEVVHAIDSQFALDPFCSSPAFLGHADNMANIGECLDLLELLLTECAIIENDRAEDRSTLAAKLWPLKKSNSDACRSKDMTSDSLLL